MESELYGSLTSKSFSEAALGVLKFLNDNAKFNLWVVTRKNGDDYIVLQSEDHGYDVGQGATFKWVDTFCSRMVAGEGPDFSPDISHCEAYKKAPFAKMADVASYIGAPICFSDGSVFGTLCAIHPQTQSKAMEIHVPMVKMFARLLGSMLTTELQAAENERRAERAETDSICDTQATWLYNKRGWEKLTTSEEKRAKQYGHHLTLVSIDLDNLKTLNDTRGHATGSAYIDKAGQIIKMTIREQDIGARIGGDEFCILLVDCNLQEAEAIVGNLRQNFTDSGIDASFGVAPFKHSETVAEALDEADKAMYEEKRGKKARKQA